jgi:hypothetical protein
MSITTVKYSPNTSTTKKKKKGQIHVKSKATEDWKSSLQESSDSLTMWNFKVSHIKLVLLKQYIVDLQ